MSRPRPGVPVKLGDGSKQRSLRYDFAAIEALEAETGEPLLVTLAKVPEMSARAISALVWAGLLHAEPELTRAQVVKLIDLGSVSRLAETVVAAITGAMGDPEPDPGKAEAAS